MESVRRSRANRQGDLIEDHSRLPSLASDDDPRGQLDRNQTVAGQRREGEFDDWLRANCSIAVGSPGTAQPVGQSGNADPIGFTKSPLRPTAGVVGIQESGALPRGMSFCHPPFSLGTVPALDGLDWTLTEILQSVKGFSAREINRRLGRAGPLWQAESYDHIVRDGDALERIQGSIRANPEKAGLPRGQGFQPWRNVDVRAEEEF